MLLIILRLLVCFSITFFTTTVFANPIPGLARGERGFDRFDHPAAALPARSRLRKGSRVVPGPRKGRSGSRPDMLKMRLDGVGLPALETSMVHYCLPPFQRNPACIRCDTIYTRPVNDENFSKFSRCAMGLDGMGCGGKKGQCTMMDAMRMYNSYAIQAPA
ncbi:MAG: hypothetical protein M1816_001645 [Peltula sp. TS41687]|nr:MAG: hypothetical protein M1816_001645 [Peltula sp. TS41687]